MSYTLNFRNVRFVIRLPYCTAIFKDGIDHGNITEPFSVCRARFWRYLCKKALIEIALLVI